MDPLHFSIALGPLAVYLLLLGVLHLSRHPFLTTGARDAAALGVAISGFVIAGPMELFLPHAAATRFGPYVWVLLIAFYFLCLTLFVLLMRPRLVIYHVTAEQLRSLLATVAVDLDKEARWAGDSLSLPQLGVQLHLEPGGTLRCIQLVSAGPRQNYAGWRRLELSLGLAVRRLRVGRNPFGLSFALLGIALLILITVRVVSDPLNLQQALSNMFRT